MKQIRYLAAASVLFAAAPAIAADYRAVPAAPRVIYAAAPVEMVAVEQYVQRYVVDQGPHYSGPNLVDFPRPVFHEDHPPRAYPYVRTWEAAHAYVPVAPAPMVRYRAPISRLN